jgi:DNA-binding PadR family transcriptional regulator
MYDPYMVQEVRVTANVGRVLRVLLDDPGVEHYGYTLMRASGLPSGNLYPILGRLEAAGWIEGHREDIDSSSAGRRPRRYYRLTAGGASEARIALAALRASLGDRTARLPGTPGMSPA